MSKITWAQDAHSGTWYPQDLGLGKCPMVDQAGSMWRVRLPGVSLGVTDTWHTSLEAAQAAAIRLVVEIEGPRIRREAARLAELEVTP